MTIVFQIPVQRGGNGNDVVATQKDFIATAFNFKNIAAMVGGNEFDDKLFRLSWNNPLNQTARGVQRRWR